MNIIQTLKSAGLNEEDMNAVILEAIDNQERSIISSFPIGYKIRFDGFVGKDDVISIQWDGESKSNAWQKVPDYMVGKRPYDNNTYLIATKKNP